MEHSRPNIGPLRLSLLGTAEAHYAGQILKFPTRKALALFVYLVVEAGLHSRDKLATLFWPESDAKRGQASLRNTLARLRRTLQVAGQPLIADGGMLGFDFESALKLDLHIVEGAVKAISNDDTSNIESLQAAVDVYRGEFLAGFSLRDSVEFDGWTTIQREIWHRRIVLIFDRLSQWQSGGCLMNPTDTHFTWLRPLRSCLNVMY